jgi:hypothetical protein
LRQRRKHNSDEKPASENQTFAGTRKYFSLLDKTEAKFLNSEQENNEKSGDEKRTKKRAEDGPALAAADVQSAPGSPGAVAEARRLQHGK